VAAICLDRPHAISEIRPTLFRETAATRPHMKTREPKLVCPLPRLNLDPVPAATKPNLDRPAGQERLGGNPTLTSNNCCRAAVRTGLGGVVPVVVAGRPGLGVCVGVRPWLGPSRSGAWGASFRTGSCAGLCTGLEEYARLSWRVAGPEGPSEAKPT